MKHREILLEHLKSLAYFSKRSIYQLSEEYRLKKGTVDAYVGRSLARKELVPLKKGLYVTSDFFDRNKSDISYTFHLANILRQPSYISSWTALQYYNLTTEATYIITSVTPKITRTYHNKSGTFMYHSIKKEFFTDFVLLKGNFDFFIASPAKALFDLIYFQTRQLRNITYKQIENLIDDWRIDIDEMSKKERDAFYAAIKKQVK